MARPLINVVTQYGLCQQFWPMVYINEVMTQERWLHWPRLNFNICRRRSEHLTSIYNVRSSIFSNSIIFFTISFCTIQREVCLRIMTVGARKSRFSGYTDHYYITWCIVCIDMVWFSANSGGNSIDFSDLENPSYCLFSKKIAKLIFAVCFPLTTACRMEYNHVCIDKKRCRVPDTWFPVSAQSKLSSFFPIFRWTYVFYF